MQISISVPGRVPRIIHALNRHHDCRRRQNRLRHCLLRVYAIAYFLLFQPQSINTNIHVYNYNCLSLKKAGKARGKEEGADREMEAK